MKLNREMAIRKAEAWSLTLGLSNRPLTLSSKEQGELCAVLMVLRAYTERTYVEDDGNGHQA